MAINFAPANKIDGFKRKLAAWQHRVSRDCYDMFPNLSEIINCESGLDATSLANIITEHLKSLAERFEFYFPKEQDPREGNGWICNPFLQLKDELNVHLEDKLLDLAGDQGLKNIFYSEITLAEFWIKVRPEYPELSELALKIILPFPSTYLCEMEFSTMSIIKTKYRNSLDVRSPLRVALSSIEPRLDKLVKSKQAHSSH